MAPLRLRVPAALAVAVLGVSAPIATSFGGCNEDTIPEPSDAGDIGKLIDASGADSGVDGGEALDASSVPVDAGADAASVAVDAAPPDAPPDAAPPPH